MVAFRRSRYGKIVDFMHARGPLNTPAPETPSSLALCTESDLSLYYNAPHVFDRSALAKLCRSSLGGCAGDWRALLNFEQRGQFQVAFGKGKTGVSLTPFGEGLRLLEPRRSAVAVFACIPARGHFTSTDRSCRRFSSHAHKSCGCHYKRVALLVSDQAITEA